MSARQSRRRLAAARNGPVAPPKPIPEMSFDELVQEGVRVAHQRAKAKAVRPRLSRKAWRAACYHLAGSGEDRLSELAKQIETSDLRHVQRFVNTLCERFRESTWPTPPPVGQMSRVLNAYGSEETIGEISQLKATPAEVVAVAGLRCATRYRDSLGSLDDVDEFHAGNKQLQERLDEIYSALRAKVSMADMTITESPREDERKRGLVVVKLKRYPDVVVTDDWPQRLISMVATQDRVAA